MVSRATTTLLVSCLASAVLLAFGCRVEQVPGVGWRITPDVGDPPDSGGVYRRVTINGRCYQSNGTYCIPCGGGELRPCSEILTAPTFELSPFERFYDSASDAAGDATDDGPGGLSGYELQFLAMTGGLDGETYQIVSGWDLWEDGDEVEGPYTVNLYTDEGHVDSDGVFHQEWLDVSFLWRADWALPAASSVWLGAYVDGDLDDDDPADMMLIRVMGPLEDVQTFLEHCVEPGTEGEVNLPDGSAWTWP